MTFPEKKLGAPPHLIHWTKAIQAKKKLANANQAKKLDMKGSFKKKKTDEKCENICSAQDQAFPETALAQRDF